MSPATEADPYGCTPTEQAESTLRSILRPESYGIGSLTGVESECPRPGEPDTMDADAWMTWSSMPPSLTARCDVHWRTGANGVRVLDVSRMTVELAKDIERCRSVFGVASAAVEAA